MTDVAGYRVLRSLGAGDRSDVLLGFRAGEQVALKVRTARDESGIREAVALERAAGDHVVRLLDLHVDDEVCCLVLERLEPHSLDDLLARRTVVDAGEVVTIVAPIALAVERMHRAGVAHSRISTASVRFRAGGAPVLIGFAHADSFPPGSPEVVLERHPGVRADRDALASITAQLLARCAGDRARAARGLVEELARGAPPPDVLAERLFALAAARPVRFEEDDAPAAVRLLEPATPIDEPPAPSHRTVLELVPEELRDRVRPALDAALRRWTSLPPRIRRLGVAAVAALVAVGALGALVPPSGAETPPEAVVVEPTPEAPTTAEDPIAAAGQLLERRGDCLAQGSLLCIDAVTQSGSAAAAVDRMLLDSGAAADAPPIGMAPGEPVLVERLGDSALVRLPAGSEPSSVLLFRTADGWRIRDYLE